MIADHLWDPRRSAPSGLTPSIRAPVKSTRIRAESVRLAFVRLANGGAAPQSFAPVGFARSSWPRTKTLRPEFAAQTRAVPSARNRSACRRLKPASRGRESVDQSVLCPTEYAGEPAARSSNNNLKTRCLLGTSAEPRKGQFSSVADGYRDPGDHPLLALKTLSIPSPTDHSPMFDGNLNHRRSPHSSHLHSFLLSCNSTNVLFVAYSVHYVSFWTQ